MAEEQQQEPDAVEQGQQREPEVVELGKQPQFDTIVHEKNGSSRVIVAGTLEITQEPQETKTPKEEMFVEEVEKVVTMPDNLIVHQGADVHQEDEDTAVKVVDQIPAEMEPPWDPGTTATELPINAYVTDDAGD